MGVRVLHLSARWGLARAERCGHPNGGEGGHEAEEEEACADAVHYPVAAIHVRPWRGRRHHDACDDSRLCTALAVGYLSNCTMTTRTAFDSAVNPWDSPAAMNFTWPEAKRSTRRVPSAFVSSIAPLSGKTRTTFRS